MKVNLKKLSLGPRGTSLARASTRLG